MLEICPMTLKEANAYVEQYHRHHKPVVGHKFSIGCSDGEKIVDWWAEMDGKTPPTSSDTAIVKS